MAWRVLSVCLGLTVAVALTVGSGAPYYKVTVLLALVGLVVSTLWLRRRDRRNYERALAREAAARAVAEDRLVIARELHDAVSGSLGAVTVRSAVAQRLETDADGLRHALRDIEETSREATDELRRMLGVLREDSGPSSPSPSSMPEDLECALAGAVGRAHPRSRRRPAGAVSTARHRHRRRSGSRLGVSARSRPGPAGSARAGRGRGWDSEGGGRTLTTSRGRLLR